MKERGEEGEVDIESVELHTEAYKLKSDKEEGEQTEEDMLVITGKDEQGQERIVSTRRKKDEEELDNIPKDKDAIKNYEEFRNMETLSHIKVNRGDYYHHFLLLAVSKISEDRDVVTVGQYTSNGEIFTESSHGIGKFEKTTFFCSREIKSGSIEKEDSLKYQEELLDFKKGVFLVTQEDYPKDNKEKQEAYERLEERIGERMYDILSNNCEHAVSYILTKESSSSQADEKRCSQQCYIDLCNVVIVDCKEIGFRTALIVAALGAIAGSLVRRAYVKILLAAVVSHTVGNQFIDCGSIKGSNIRTEAERRIDLAADLPDIKAVILQGNLDILNKTKEHLNTDFVCQTAEKLLYDAAWKTSGATLMVSVGIETIFFIPFVFFNLLPRRRRKVLKGKKFCRILFLHIFAGYGSIALSVVCGFFAFLDLDRPALSFFGVVFGSCLCLRYLLTCIAGLLFKSCCCKCCWKCCDSSCCTSCKCCETSLRWCMLSTLCFVFIVTIITAAVVLSLILFFLD